MKSTYLRDRINEAILPYWEKAPEADLTVVQLRELRQKFSDILHDGMREICAHPMPTENGWCWDCGSFALERKAMS